MARSGTLAPNYLRDVKTIQTTASSKRYAPFMTNVQILAFHGEIDIAQKESVEQELAQIERFSPSAMILDLSGVRYMDSTFLNALCQLQRRLYNREPAANLCIVAPSGNIVSRLFAITELDRVFHLFEDISSAQHDALERHFHDQDERFFRAP